MTRFIAPLDGSLEAERALPHGHNTLGDRLGSTAEAVMRITTDPILLVGPEATYDAARADARNLVVGTHARRGLARLALGNTALRVVHRSPCPVLVVRL